MRRRVFNLSPHLVNGDGRATPHKALGIKQPQGDGIREIKTELKRYGYRMVYECQFTGERRAWGALSDAEDAAKFIQQIEDEEQHEKEKFV